LPLEAHAGVALLLIAGLALWLFGGKVVKPLFAVIGLALGGLVGLFVVPALGLAEIAGAPASLVGMGIGAVIGLVIALVLLKVAVIFSAGLGFAVAGFLGATIYLQHNPLPEGERSSVVIEDDTPRSPSGRMLFTNPYTGTEMTIEELTRTLRDADRVLGRGPAGGPANALDDGAGAGEAPTSRERFEAVAVRCRAVAAEAYESAKTHVNALSARERIVVFGSTFGALALGMLVGFALPKRSTAFITALAGSAIWLFAGVWLIDALAPSWNHLTDHSPETWGIVWGIVFLLGLVVQLSGLGKKKDGSKPGRSRDADDDGDDDEDE